ncbi:MAG: YbdK family carboxylate-amine ligase, partial [Nitrospirae bacterium]
SESFDLQNIAPFVLNKVPEGYKKRIKEEFLQSMVELNTTVCANVRQVDEDLKDSLNRLNEILHSESATFFSASLHPFAFVKNQRITVNPRYNRIMDDLQIVGRRFISQGLHIHIGVTDPETAIKVTDEIRLYLPLLLAITTSSPFYEGEKTGLYSYRTKLYDALPRAGLPEYLGSWHDYLHLVEVMKRGGYIESVKDIWWDVRPHPDFGTVEVRICDLPSRLSEILGVTALIQALVVKLSEIGRTNRIPMQLLKSNKWQAARYSLDGVFLDPLRGNRFGIRDAISMLLEFVEPVAAKLGSIEYLNVIEDILQQGTSAHRQLRYYEQSGEFKGMIKKLQEEFYS